MSNQATILVDSAATQTMGDNVVFPALAGAVTGSGSAIAAQVTALAMKTYFGQADTFTSPMTLGTLAGAFTIQGTASAGGTDVASSAITFNANTGTSAGAVGGFAFAVPITTSTGTTPQTLTNALVVGATTVPMVYMAGADAGSGLLSPIGQGAFASARVAVVSTSGSPAFTFVRALGTLGAPTIITSGTALGSLRWQGAMTATTTILGAQIDAAATENWVNATSAGTKLNFRVVPNTTASTAIALTLDQDKSATFAGAIVGATTATITGAFGCNAATAQTAFASGGAAPAGGTGAAAGGWDTAGHRDAAITLINNMRTALINCGIMS